MAVVTRSLIVMPVELSEPSDPVNPATGTSPELTGPVVLRTPCTVTKADGSKFEAVTETNVPKPPLVGLKVTLRTPRTVKSNKADRPALVTFKVRAPVLAFEGIVTVPDNAPMLEVLKDFVALLSQLSPELSQKAAVKSEEVRLSGQYEPVTLTT